jgi:hypothetical protein
LSFKGALAGATVAVSLGATSGGAAVVPGSSFSGGSSSGTDPYGNMWQFAVSQGPQPHSFWTDLPSFPGYGGKPNATDFEITFSGLAASEIDSIVETPIFLTTNVLTPQWSDAISGSEVTFTAQPGFSLTAGLTYQIVVSFITPNVNGDNSNFNADFTYTPSVPEASSWVMMTFGFAAVGAVGWRAHRWRSEGAQPSPTRRQGIAVSSA